MADFRIVVKIDPTGARRGARQVESELDRVSRGADRARRLIARTFAFVGIGAAITGSIRLLANFEQEMSTVRAVTGATAGQFALLREEAKALGISTRFTATQAAEGMTFLARAGFDVNEVLAATGQVLTLAQAGALDLGRAADIASNVLQGFNIAAQESQRVVDVLALAANSANTNVEQLGQAMSFVAPAAAALDVSLESTAAAIGALSDAGIQATRAGTGLRMIFIQLQDSGDDLLNIAERGLIPVLETLRDRNIGLSEAADLVGARQASALLVLTKSIPKLQELTGSLEDAEGTAQRVADIMDDNLNGAILQMVSALQGLIIELGDAGATGALTSLFRAIARGLRFLASNIDTVVDAIESVSVALFVLFAGKAIPAAISGLKLLAVALVSNPFGVLAVAISSVIGLFVGFGDRVKLTGEGAASVFDFMVVAFNRLVGVMQVGLDFLIGLLTGFQFDLETFDFLEFVRNGARGIDAIVGVFTGGFDAIVELWRNLPRVIGDLIVQGLNFVIRKVEDFINSIIRALNAIPGVAVDTLDGVLPQIANPFEGAAAGVGKAAADGFARGFNDGLAQGVVEEIAADAERRALERKAVLDEQEAARLAALAGGAPGLDDDQTGTGTGSGGGRSVAGLDDRNAALEREIQLLQREADVLSLVGDEREVLSAKIAVEEKLRSALREANKDLTEEQINNLASLDEAEAATIEQLVLHNLELGRQAQLLDDIKGPQREFEDNLGSLNALLERGEISLDEYNIRFGEMRYEVLQHSRDLDSGIERAFLSIQDTITDHASNIERALVNAYEEANGAQRNFEYGLRAINILLDRGEISLEQYKDQLIQLKLASLEAGRDLESGLARGLLRIEDEFGDVASVAENSLVSAFRSAEDALNEFVNTGKLDFGSLVDSILADITRLAIRESITAPLAGFLGGLGGGGGGGGILSGLFGGGGGGGGGLLSGLGSLFGFAHGGAFEVGGRGGTDNNVLSVNGQPVARVSRGETVNVSPNGGGGERPVQVIFNITTQDADSFRRSQDQIMARAASQLNRSSRRNT